MSTRKEPYVPASPHELIGYLASAIKHAAEAHPQDVDLARALSVYQAWEATQGWDRPTVIVTEGGEPR